jgi:putative RecB family exonuclease
MKLQELRQKPHISYSQLETYNSCSLLYKFSRIDRLPPEFIPDNLVFGSTIHKLLAQFYEAKMVGDLMLLSDIHELFKKLWTEAAKDRDDIQYSKGKSFESYLAEGIGLLSAWHNKLPDDDFKVVAIEEAFSFTLPGVSVPIIGAIDLLEEDESGTLIITDFKTSSRSLSISEIDSNQQVTIYQLSSKANGFGDREIILKLDCLIKTKTPKFEQYYTTRSVVDERRIIRKIEKTWEAISSGIFVPDDLNWRHNNCQYRKTCDEWFLEGGD